MTRRIISAILNHELDNVTFEKIPHFNLAIPTSLNGVDAKLLNPKKAWRNEADYNRHAEELIEAFIANFKKFNVSADIATAGPELIKG